MENKKIAAGIVLFNPNDKERLKKSILSVLRQVKKVYIFDNSTKRENFDFFENVCYMTENQNKGIAYALNKIMDTAQKEGYEWLITMDQDSMLPDGTIKAYEKYIDGADMTGIICPQVIDVRRSYMKVKKEPETEYIDFCITSASCTNIDVWDKVGRFDNKLFIDLVDNDFCKRLRLSGYKILRVNRLVLDQEFGEITPKSKFVQRFWNKIGELLNNINFAKLGYKKKVNPLRIYYTCRNVTYLNKKFMYYGGIGYKDNYNCNTFSGFIVSFVIPSIVRSKHKLKTLKAAADGFKDGRKLNVKPWTKAK